MLSEEQVTEAFDKANLNQGEPQLEMIFAYLKNKKIGIGQPADPFDYMTREEIDYLEEYLKAVQAGADVTDGVKEAVLLSAMAGDADAKHRLIEIFLPQVAEIAKLYAGQGVFLEDLIGEGNVALTMAAEMLDCAQNAKEAEGTIASMIMEAMENYISENASEKKTGEKLAENANDILEKAEELSKELGRKVTVKAKAVGVTEVTLDRAELTLTEGETETLTATVRPDNADNKKVTWSSDKTEIATVDGAGKVTAVKAGEAVVTVTTEDGGKTATCKVTVKAKVVPVTGVEVNPWAMTLSVRGTSKLSYTIRPADATNQNVKWESESPSVATVDSEGNVQGVAAGTAKICVTTEDGGFKSYCTVTVKKAESKFEVGGLWYEYYYAPNLARVIPDPDGIKYGGNISIPGQIEYGGITYSVYQIGSHAFYECADLKSVTLGEGIEFIDARAFYNCPNLERITFSSTMNSFDTGNPVFERCPKLEIVTTPKTSESQLDYFYTHGGALYKHCYYSEDTGVTEVLSWLPEKTTGVFTIKDGVEVIDRYSLTFTGIDKIIIPESVKYIGSRFFNDSKTPLEIELNWRTKEDIDRISTIESDPSGFFFVRTDRSAVKVTVPKGTKSLYESHWLWSHLGGIEERP